MLRATHERGSMIRATPTIKLTEAGCLVLFISEIPGHHSLEFARLEYPKFSPASAANAGWNYQISIILPLLAA